MEHKFLLKLNKLLQKLLKHKRMKTILSIIFFVIKLLHIYDASFNRIFT